MRNTCTLQGRMQTQKTLQKKSLYNPFEAIYELGKDTAKRAVKETVDILNPLSEMFGGEAQKMRSEGKNDFSDINVMKLQSAYEKDDQEEIIRIQRILNPEQAEEQDAKKEEGEYHRRVQQDEKEYNLRKEQEGEEEEREEALDLQRKKQEEDAEHAQPLESPKGKVRKNILGGGKQKATSELPTEFRPDAGKQ